jgi:hypothetical protein
MGVAINDAVGLFRLFCFHSKTPPCISPDLTRYRA